MKTKEYSCPTCKKPIETRVPERDMVNPEKGYWDSLVQCPHCEELNFKKVWPSGKIEAKGAPTC